MIGRLINGAWIAACGREHRRLLAALRDVERVQRTGLLERLARNAGTRFGRVHGFAGIRTVADYQARVPVGGHAAYADDLAAIARGEPAVLTRGRIERFLPTSGSTSASKLVPWTAALGREFRRGIDPWLAALYRRVPGLLATKAYWSISPQGTVARREGLLPVGFDDDSAYLGFVGRALFGRVSVVPAGLERCTDPAEFRDRTLLALLAEPRLGLVSVWSPTFLTVLMDHFRSDPDRLLDSLARQSRRGLAGRVARLRRVLRELPEAAWWPAIWPELRVISCWTHGPSALYAARLQERFPGVEMQGKGLVATEAFVSLPLEPALDPVLAVRSHFFEFVDPANGAVGLAHEVREGGLYRVLVTTEGGLYRYDLGDLVRVTGRLGDAPCLRFVGREGNVSDRFGEKLHGPLVADAMDRLFDRHGIRPRFRMLAPVETAAGGGYALFIGAELSQPERVAEELDEALRSNFHYDHCRKLGQLSRVRIFQLDPAGPGGETVYQAALLARGLKPGEIKMTPLDADTGWERRFAGRWLA